MSEGIPPEWSRKLLGEVFDIAIGGTPSRSIEEYWDKTKGSGNAWVSIKDLSQKCVVDTVEYITDIGVQNSNVKLIPKGTVMMSFKLTIGRTALAGRDLYTNEAIASFLPKDSSAVDTRYFYQGLQHWNLLESVDQAVKGATLNKEKLSLIEGLFPEYAEQQQIASILTSVDEVIEKTEAQISKLQDLKKGMMQELLTKGIGHTEFKDSPVGRVPKGWGVADLGSLFSFKNGVNKGGEHFGHGVPIISYKNVYVGGGLSLSDITGKVDLTPAEIERFNVCYGDVFFTRTSETAEEIGLSNVYLGENSNVVYNGFVIRARPMTEELSPEFCKYCFSSESVRQQMVHGSKYTTRAGISSEFLGKIRVTVPPLVEQEKIAEAIGSIEALSVLTIIDVLAFTVFDGL